jgi:hypothetical protein
MTKTVSVSFRHRGLYPPVSCMTEFFRIRHQQQRRMDYMTRTHNNNGEPNHSRTMAIPVSHTHGEPPCLPKLPTPLGGINMARFALSGPGSLQAMLCSIAMASRGRSGKRLP